MLSGPVTDMRPQDYNRFRNVFAVRWLTKVARITARIQQLSPNIWWELYAAQWMRKYSQSRIGKQIIQREHATTNLEICYCNTTVPGGSLVAYSASESVLDASVG
jgi:hypothetical protein